MEINENVHGMKKYDYLKYEFFVIKCYNQNDPIFTICDKMTFYYLNCNHNSITIKSLIESGYCRIEFTQNQKNKKPIPIVCGIEDKHNLKKDESLYETFASSKINKSNLQENKLAFAFSDKIVEELPMTFRLVSAHMDLQDSIDSFIKIIEERKKINYKLKDFEIMK